MKLEEKITLHRKRNGWSQEELAFRLDVSRQAVSKWEMGSSVPDLDKIIRMSDLFGVTTDYLLKEEVAETDMPTEEETASSDTPEMPKRGRQVCDEECKSYVSLVKKTAWKIALGVAFCILSPACMFALLGASASGALAVSEDVAGGIGIVALLIVCAFGLLFLIPAGIALSKYEYLEKEELLISETMKDSLCAEKDAGAKAFTAAIAVGVSLCVLSVVPVLLAGVLEGAEAAPMYALTATLSIVAIGVALFVRFGVIRGAYSKLLQEEEYTVEKKREGKKTSVFSGVYWCLVTALYLAWSFWTMEWGRTWIVWPIAGVLFGAIGQIVAAITKNKK